MNDTTLYIRPVTLPERSYTYSQSQQISMQTGFIGYLRADMDSKRRRLLFLLERFSQRPQDAGVQG